MKKKRPKASRTLPYINPELYYEDWAANILNNRAVVAAVIDSGGSHGPLVRAAYMAGFNKRQNLNVPIKRKLSKEPK